ncbi:MAG: hypothetical protein V1803_01360 [Candidatus Roizmanbacteria bacterium]
MLSKKSIIFIAFFFVSLTFFPQLESVDAYTCNQSCALDHSGCNAPLDCYRIGVQWRCRHPDCTIEASCVCPTNTPTPTLTPTPTPTNTPTPTPTPGPWVKLKNSSFMSSDNLNMPIPDPPIISYDGDDNGSANFIIGNGGLVSAPSVNLTILNPNAKPSINDWSVTYTPSSYSFTASSFLSYIKARKEYTKIISIDEIDSEGIYYYDGASLNLNSVPAVLNQYNVVLISTGTIDIDVANFAPTKSIAFIAPIINFSASTTYAKGIFIGTTITSGTTANQGLKIVGNFVAQTTFTNNRKWSNPRQPSIFIINDYQQYFDLLPYLSIANYEWRQIQ